MNLYGDSSKDSEIKLRIGTGDSFSYEELQQFYKDELLEDFDLFKVSSEFFDHMYMYYYDDCYYLISSGKKIKRIDPSLLTNRHFVVASKSITNNVQHYIQLHGLDALEGLDEQELIKIVMGSEYKDPESQVEVDELGEELSL